MGKNIVLGELNQARRHSIGKEKRPNQILFFPNKIQEDDYRRQDFSKATQCDKKIIRPGTVMRVYPLHLCESILRPYESQTDDLEYQESG